MIEKKDPQQESAKTDLFDDDDIIELTEEVKTKSDDDADIIELKPGATAYAGKIRTSHEPPPSTMRAQAAFTEDEDLFTEDDEDIIASAIDRFGKAGVDEDAMVPDDEVDFEFDDDDDHFMGEDQSAEGKDEFVALGDDESMEMLEEEDALDFEEELDLEFETDEDEPEVIAVGKEEDDITAEVAEELPASTEGDDRLEPAADVPIEPENAMDIFALTEEEGPESESPADAFEVDADTNSPDEDDLDLTALIADQAEEGDDDLAFADESAAAVAGEEDEIVEITEFDQHFAGEPGKSSETADLFDESDLAEEDFLEPIEVEEDSSPGEETGELREPETETTDVEMSRFFSDAGPAQTGLAGRSIEIFETAPVLDPELAAATAETAAEPEKFSFDMETKEISVQIDRLDTFLSEDSASEPAVAFLPDEQPGQAERSAEGFQKSALKDAVMDLIPEHLDTAIERLIDEKFSGKIENIIYEVIEKAVSKEIDRLKGILLENDGNADRH